MIGVSENMIAVSFAFQLRKEKKSFRIERTALDSFAKITVQQRPLDRRGAFGSEKWDHLKNNNWLFTTGYEWI